MSNPAAKTQPEACPKCGFKTRYENYTPNLWPYCHDPWHDPMPVEPPPLRTSKEPESAEFLKGATMQNKQVEQVAKICHEANRAYCETIGDNSQPTWEKAPQWQKDSAINGV